MQAPPWHQHLQYLEANYPRAMADASLVVAMTNVIQELTRSAQGYRQVSQQMEAEHSLLTEEVVRLRAERAAPDPGAGPTDDPAENLPPPSPNPGSATAPEEP